MISFGPFAAHRDIHPLGFSFLKALSGWNPMLNMPFYFLVPRDLF